jgi:hypothetical protein
MSFLTLLIALIVKFLGAFIAQSSSMATIFLIMKEPTLPQHLVQKD